MAYRIRTLTSLENIAAEEWDALCPNSYPFTRHAFLHALESSLCVGGDSGWETNHLLVESENKLVAILPGYLKLHSYGEYVFDWSWAEAYERHGLDYYPKLLFAIPFTPVTGPRLLVADGPPTTELVDQINLALRELCQSQSLSGWHMLFAEEPLINLLGRLGNAIRQDVQFEWKNRDYDNFDDFLGTMRSAKRKQIRRERRRVAEQGIELFRRRGADLTESDWEFFYHCYQQTYAKRSGHGGYLNRRFFQEIAESMADQVMLVFALHADRPVAAALFFHDQEALYGRYWGCVAELDCLHFETCYYQGIEFAIEQGLQRFNPGTQGEHKLARGFEPTVTFSVHRLVDARFQSAVDAYLKEERTARLRYAQECRNHLPFHGDGSDG